MPQVTTTTDAFLVGTPDATQQATLRTRIGAAPVASPIFTGQVQLASAQAATDDNSAMTRGLSDARYLRLENWVFEGDSWTAGTAQGNDRECYPYYISKLLSNQINIINVATAGQTAATMVGTFSAQVTPNLTATTGRPSTAFIFAGINDVGTNDAAAITSLQTNLRSMWASARSAGAKVVAFTLPHRTAGGWTQANWATINANIIADSSYYDVLIRMDIIQSNAASSEYADGLHITTTAHQKLAGIILEVLRGASARPSIIPNQIADAIYSPTISSNTNAYLRYQNGTSDNADTALETISGQTTISVFNAPISGLYEISANVLMGGIASGDTVFLLAAVVPIATGTPAEYRLHYNVASGTAMGLCGRQLVRLSRGDKVYFGVNTSKSGASILTNGKFSSMNIRFLYL